MSYNNYNARQSTSSHHGYNRFAPAGQLSAAYPDQRMMDRTQPQDHDQNVKFNTMVTQPPQQVQQKREDYGDFIQVTKQENDPTEDMTSEDFYGANDQPADQMSSDDTASQKPHWMKPKLQGVRKISNKERRRRQNESLRRLLSPKNALMVLNEIEKDEKTFTVQPMCAKDRYFRPSTNTFCAALRSGGTSYQGYGENKLAARNAAAEQAVRDMLLKKMNSIVEGEPGADCEDNLPMIQLASFALYKLFSEWEGQGHLVPQLRGTPQGSDAGSECASGSGRSVSRSRFVRTELPEGAADMHPCMLLSQMRPGLVYQEAAAEGDLGTKITFVMQIAVGGQVYEGKASNKREARKAAAREACRGLFGLRFNDEVQ